MNAFECLVLKKMQKTIEDENRLCLSIQQICEETGKISEEIMSVLDVIHSFRRDVPAYCLESRKLLDKAREGYLKLKEAISHVSYYKYYEYWRPMTEQFSFVIAYIVWLEQGFLVPPETVADFLGMHFNKPDEHFQLVFDDYISGILILTSELARYARNSISHGDYDTPLQILKFVREVYTGTHNISDDVTEDMHKRIIELESDVISVEGMIYDIFMKELLPAPQGTEGNGIPVSVYTKAFMIDLFDEDFLN